MKSIAIVEDEDAIRDNYVEALGRYGYAVTGYATRQAAEQGMANVLPDLVIIDVGLADEPEGGFALCRALRGRSALLPILFLTARDADIDVVSGLRLGADDYLSKDISLAQLSARVAALFRRQEALSEPERKEQWIECRALTLSVERMDARWQGQSVGLTVTEFWMVHALAKRPGHVKSREQLMRDAHTVIDEHTVTSHIKRIRRKFQALDAQFDDIETMHGAGYRWRP